MRSKAQIQSTMFNDLLSSRLVVNVLPVDAGGDGLVVTMLAKALRIDARFDLVIVGLAGAFIVLLTRRVIDGLVGEVIGVGVDMLTELVMVVVAAAAIALEVFVTVLSFCC